MVENKTSSDGLVIVGVDGSESSIHALRWAARYAEALHERVRAIMVWHYPVNLGYDTVSLNIDFEGDAHKQLETALADIRKEYPSVDFESQVINRPPAAALIDASATADLLVVGSRGHGGFTGMLLGSVSAHCMHHASCPVVVIREPSTT